MHPNARANILLSCCRHMNRYNSFHYVWTKASFRLVSLFTTLLLKGFCCPDEEQGDGDGEGDSIQIETTTTSSAAAAAASSASASRPRVREQSAEEQRLRRRHREAMVLNDGTHPPGHYDIIEREHDSNS